MKIERFEVAGLAQFGYVLSDDGEAVVIDAMRDVERYVEYAQREGLRITAVLETHIHADFAAGSCELAAMTGAELAFSGYDEGEHYVYAMAHRKLRDGEAVRVGTATLRALHTPGHTPEHLSYLLYEAGAAAPVAMFSGDFLFVGALGRPDLLGEEAKVGLAHALYRSVRERVAELPDSVRVYPGHGAGSFCGAGLGDQAETTLGDERRMNAYFGYSEAEFVQRILASVPEMPKYYPRMKALNAKGAAAVASLPTLQALSAEQGEAMARQGAQLLDVRSAQAFAEGHLAGTIHMGAGPDLALWAGWLLRAEKPIVLVGEAEVLPSAMESLRRVGLDDVAGFLEGGVAAWAEERPLLRSVAMMPAEVAAGQVLVLDVRRAEERRSGFIAGSMPIPLGELAERVDELPRGRAIVTVCMGGYRASVAQSLLERAGFDSVNAMAGGMGGWVQQGLPVVQ